MSSADRRKKVKVVILGCLETETQPCTSFDVYTALLFLEPSRLIHVPGIRAATNVPVARKPAESAFSLYAGTAPKRCVSLAVSDVDAELRQAGYLLRENELLIKAQALAAAGTLSPSQKYLVGNWALSRQFYDDVFKLTLSGLNETKIQNRLTQIEKLGQAAASRLASEVPELRRFLPDLLRIQDCLQRRRETLSATIAAEARRGAEGTVVVLCGVAEKAAFAALLEKTGNFDLVEYSMQLEASGAFAAIVT
jgi:hypothetical protein